MPDHVWLALKDGVLTNLATVALVHLVCGIPVTLFAFGLILRRIFAKDAPQRAAAAPFAAVPGSVAAGRK
jgi:uncharacterized membrane protein YdfJ with MMPL/SSD domain